MEKKKKCHKDWVSNVWKRKIIREEVDCADISLSIAIFVFYLDQCYSLRVLSGSFCAFLKWKVTLLFFNPSVCLPLH